MKMFALTISIIDSKSAKCGNNDSTCSIKKAILFIMSDGFQTINSIFEQIQLQYLLNYPLSTTMFKDEVGRSAELLAWSIKVIIPRIYIFNEDSIPPFENYDEQLISAFIGWINKVH